MKQFFNILWPYISLPILAILLYLFYKVLKQLFLPMPGWEDDYDNQTTHKKTKGKAKSEEKC